MGEGRRRTRVSICFHWQGAEAETRREVEAWLPWVCCRRASKVQGGRQSSGASWRLGQCCGHQNVGRGTLLQVGTPRQEENQCVGSHRFAIVRQGGVEEVVGKSPFHTGQGEFTETSFFNSAGVACAVGSLKLRLKASSFVQGVVLHIQHWKVLTLSMAGKLLYRFLFEFCR